MKSSKLLCILSALATALLVLSASVAAPILCRPFYYAHIAPLELTRYGLPAEEIRRAYGEMMDYCLGLRPDFAAGVLPASPEGAAHFADVRALFLLDLGVLVLSALVLAVLFAVGRRKKLIPAAPLGTVPASGPRPDWRRSFSRWAVWRPWTSSGPLWCSILCFSLERPTGSLTGGPTPSSSSCRRPFSGTAPC